MIKFISGYTPQGGLQMNKKKLLKRIVPVLLIACAAAYAFIPGVKTAAQQSLRTTKSLAAHYELTSNVDAMNIRQVITEDSETLRTIMWQSAMAEDDAVVEYHEQGQDEVYAVAATSEAFTDDGVTTYIHKATLTELSPGTAYEYRVGYGQKRSAWIRLHTAEGNEFKALIFPDSQSSDYSVWAATLDPAWQAHPDAQFAISMGDLVDNGQDHYQWNAWFDAAEDMISKIPIAPAMGNHETYNRDWKIRMPEAYLRLFALPANAPEPYRNQFYSFDYGDVHFVVLNTQISEMAQFQPKLLEDEMAWFRQDMVRTTKKWKVVVMHKDVLQYGFQNRPQPREEGFSEEGRQWMPLFDEYGVDVVLSAHLHSYRDRGHIRNFQRDASGPLYILTGVAGSVQYPGLWKNHSLDEYAAPQPETENYLVMEASDATLTFTGYLPSGEELHTVSIQK